MTETSRPRLLWGITSSGDMIREVVDTMIHVASLGTWDIEVMLSREAPFVMKYYNTWETLRERFGMIHVEKGPNAPFLGGPIQKKRYAMIVVAPVTGNTMAKIARGIADSLIPNCVALGLKARVPVALFPTDQAVIGEETILRDGTRLQLFPRQVDLDNVEAARRMQHVTVFSNLEEMRASFDKASRALQQ